MIVIFIISIVGGVMTYNMKGSLVKGRAFKTEMASKEAYDILSLELAQGTPMEDILNNPGNVIKGSGLVKTPKKLLQDGWGKNFSILQIGDDDFILYSKKWTDYLAKEKGMKIEDIEENYPWAYNQSAVGDPETSS